MRLPRTITRELTVPAVRRAFRRGAEDTLRTRGKAKNPYRGRVNASRGTFLHPWITLADAWDCGKAWCESQLLPQLELPLSEGGSPCE